mmetsp:Transcript_11152/g.27417  ORF Transcript_11152/g.27417 Transcript_11152/m.27417 type:complete len:83 (+) Transcript_11152:129-377(+)
MSFSNNSDSINLYSSRHPRSIRDLEDDSDQSDSDDDDMADLNLPSGCLEFLSDSKTTLMTCSPPWWTSCVELMGAARPLYFR